MSAILGRFQARLEQLHDTPTEMDVRSYVVGDATRREISDQNLELPEQLFVREDDEGMEVALYISPEVVAQLESDDPWQRLHPGNLESFCIALEGVSHFVMLAWCAAHTRSVTPLELELQAEVDKFVAAWLLLADQGQALAATATPLAKQLFAAYSLRDGLSPDEVDRYHAASRAAQRFCTSLARRHGRDGRVQAVENDLRAYYRLGLNEKLRAA